MGFGSQTAAAICGGLTTANVALTEEYNGTSFSEVNDYNNARRNAGNHGTSQTAGMIYGGADDNPSNKTEHHD